MNFVAIRKNLDKISFPKTGEDTNRNDLLIRPGGLRKINWHTGLAQTDEEESSRIELGLLSSGRVRAVFWCTLLWCI